jgi:hypothetical protein
MTQLTIKIVDTEGDSILVKFASENSAHGIDEYDAVAFQPQAMGYTTKEEFIEGIKPALLEQVKLRDKLENSEAVDVSSWVDTIEVQVEEPLDPDAEIQI